MNPLLKKILTVTLCLFALSGTLLLSKGKLSEQISSQKPYYSIPVTDTVTAGDINGDNKVNNKDLIRLFKYLSNWNVYVNKDALDVNCDNQINNKDIVRLFKYLSNWNVEIYPKQTECAHNGTTGIRNIIKASCTELGYSGDTYCLICGRKISSGTVVPGGAHSFTNYIKNNDATCATDGTLTAKCDNCNETDTIQDVGSALGHEYVISSDTTAHWQECTRCHNVTEHESHTGGNATYLKKAVCDFCGVEYGNLAQMLAYDCLTDIQKGIYNAMAAAFISFETETDIPSEEGVEYETMMSDMVVAYNAVLSDKPEYFWAPRDGFTPGYYQEEFSGKIVGYCCNFKYVITQSEKDSML